MYNWKFCKGINDEIAYNFDAIIIMNESENDMDGFVKRVEDADYDYEPSLLMLFAKSRSDYADFFNGTDAIYSEKYIRSWIIEKSLEDDFQEYCKNHLREVMIFEDRHSMRNRIVEEQAEKLFETIRENNAIFIYRDHDRQGVFISNESYEGYSSSSSEYIISSSSSIAEESSTESSSIPTSGYILHVIIPATLNGNNMATSYNSYNGDYVYDSISNKYYLDGDTTSSNYIYYTGTAWAIYSGSYKAYTFNSSSDVNSISGTNTWSGMLSTDGAAIYIEIDDCMSYEYDLNIMTYTYDYDTSTQTRTDNGNNSDYTGLFKQISRNLNGGYIGDYPYVIYCKDDDPSYNSHVFAVAKNDSSWSIIKTTYEDITIFEKFVGGRTTSTYTSLYSYLIESMNRDYITTNSSSFSNAICSFRSAFKETSNYKNASYLEYSTFAISITDVEKTSFVLGTITFSQNQIVIDGTAKSEIEIDLNSYTTVSNSNTPVFSGNLPIGLSFDGTSITGTPKYGDTNSYSITASASNCDNAVLTIQFNITGDEMKYWDGYIATSSDSTLSGLWEKYTSTTVDDITYNTYRHFYDSYIYLYYTKDSSASKNYWVVSYNNPSNSSYGITTFNNNFGYSDFIEGNWTLSSSYSSYSLSFDPAGTITVPSSSVTLSGASGAALTLNLASYITVSNGNTPTLSGNLPIGLSFSGTSITGTPKYANTDTFTITVSATDCISSTFNIVAAITGTEMTYADSYIGTSNNSNWNGIWTKYSLTTTVDEITYNTYSFTYSGITYYMFYTKDTTSSNNYWVICGGGSGNISNSMQVTSNYSYASAHAAYIEGTWTCSSSSYTLSFSINEQTESVNYFTASNCGIEAVNGTYYLYSGTHGQTNAVYYNDKYYIYYSLLFGWLISSTNGKVPGLYYTNSAESITGTWQIMSGGTAPVPTFTEP